METLRLVLLFLHVLGFAALLGGLLVQARDADKTVNAAMRDGIGTAFVTGLLLVGVLESGDTAVDHAKIGVKFAVGLVHPGAGDGQRAQAQHPAGPLARPARADARQHRGGRLLVARARLTRRRCRPRRGCRAETSMSLPGA